VRLDLGALGGVGGAVLVGGREALQQRVQLRARRRRVLGESQRLGDAPGRVREAEQDVLRRDPGGLLGDGCRDERVAVAVAADPRAETDERAHDGRTAASARPLQGVVDAPVHVRDSGVEGLVEDRHDGAHLVDGRRLLRAQRRGAPQRVDLLEHAALGAALVGAALQRRVVLAEASRDGGCSSTPRDGAPRSGAP
jgi:hypothetical protein